MSEEQGQEQQGEEQYQSDQSASNKVGVTLSQSVEGNVIAEVMEEKEGVEVTHFPAMIRIRSGRVTRPLLFLYPSLQIPTLEEVLTQGS